MHNGLTSGEAGTFRPGDCKTSGGSVMCAPHLFDSGDVLQGVTRTVCSGPQHVLHRAGLRRQTS